MLVLLVTASTMGLFFAMIRLHAESEMVFGQRAEQAQAAVRHFDDRFSRVQFSALSAEAWGGAKLFHVGRYTPVFYRMGDEEPKDITNLHIVEVLEQRDNWKLIRNLSGKKWIDTDWVPDEILLDVPGFNQQTLGLPTGCEIVALAMVINMYIDVDVFHLLDEMPRNYDPLLGFRGDPFTRGGFTILPPALLELTERYIGSAVDMTGASIEDVQAQLALGRPVLTWLRGMFGFNVHVITLTGFNQYGFFYNDPWLGGVNEFIYYAEFLAMWEDPIQDMRLHRTYPPRIALSY